MSDKIVPTLRHFPAESALEEPAGPLRVLTLNIAHGRGISAHQLFLPKLRIEKNLREIAEVLIRERPHLVALQEVDCCSAWNGNFDHLEFLAKSAGYQFGAVGEHMQKLSLRYGTALLSNLPLSDPLSLRFRSSGVLPPKGFLIGSITWPESDFIVDIVSLHLDFLRSRVRYRQMDPLLEELRARRRPLIVMGDFNCDWSDTLSAVKRLIEELDLIAYEPQLEQQSTFRFRKKRWDWILLSKELRFVSHRILADSLSDHFAVLAEIDLKESP